MSKTKEKIMGETKKALGRSAKKDFEEMEKQAKRASEKLKTIGDPDGKKLADNAADAAKKGKDYIEKRLG
jgi:hypothetical protein